MTSVIIHRGRATVTTMNDQLTKFKLIFTLMGVIRKEGDVKVKEGKLEGPTSIKNGKTKKKDVKNDYQR